MNEKRSVALYVSDIVDDEICERKPFMAVLFKLKNIRQQALSHSWIYEGTMVHEILYSTITKKYSRIEHYYSKEQTIEKAILETMKEVYSAFTKKVNSGYSQHWDKKIFSTISINVYKALPSLSSFCKTLFIEKEKKIESLIIGAEYPINLQLNRKYILKGRIDVLAWDKEKKKMRIIELKTGKESYRNKSQVKIYAEAFREKNIEKEIVTELWYVKSNKKKIIPSSNSSDEIERIKRIIKLVEEAKTEKDLPPMTEDKIFCEEYCKMCENINKVFQKKKTNTRNAQVVFEQPLKKAKI